MVIESPFYPFSSLRLEFVVIQYPRKWQKTVHPVRSAFPTVAFAAEPAVVVADNLRISLVKMGGNAVALAFEGLAEPAGGFDSTKREFFISSAELRRAAAGSNDNSDKEDGYSFHIFKYTDIPQIILANMAINDNLWN